MGPIFPLNLRAATRDRSTSDFEPRGGRFDPQEEHSSRGSNRRPRGSKSEVDPYRVGTPKFNGKTGPYNSRFLWEPRIIGTDFPFKFKGGNAVRVDFGLRTARWPVRSPGRVLFLGIEPATSRSDVRSRPVSTCPALPPLNLTGKSVPFFNGSHRKR